MANQIILFNTGRAWMLRQLAFGAHTILDGNVTFRFFVNDLTLSVAGPSVPFIALNMPGYAPFTLSGGLDEGIDANGNDTVIWPVSSITCTATSGGPWLAFGYWVTANADGTVLWGQLFDVPAGWKNLGDTNTVAPQFSLGTLLLSSPVVLTPVVITVAPSSGPAGAESPVLISGAYFTGATAVTFGGTPAATFEVVNDNTILATSPSLPASVVDVQVITGFGISQAWAYDRFTYT